MTWLWDKVRHSLRSGRLRARIQSFLQAQDSDSLLVLSSEKDLNSPLECEDDELITYFGVCSTCKLAIHHTRNLNISALEIYSSRSTICSFCGLRYRETIGRQSVQNNNNNISSNGIIDDSKESEYRREQRSRSNADLSHNRLPPIGCQRKEMEHKENKYDRKKMLIRSFQCSKDDRHYDNNDGSSLGRLENFNMLLSLNSRIAFLLPPISRDKGSDPTRNIESRSRSSSLTTRQKQGYNVSNEGSQTLNHRVRLNSRQEFLKNLRKARRSEDYNILHYFYKKTFSSFRELCSLFKLDPSENGADVEDPELKLEFVYSVHDAISELPSTIQETILKSIKNALSEESKVNFDGDEIRSVFILLQCPIFIPQSSYHAFAHLLRYCVNLPTLHHQLLVGWFKILDIQRLRAIISQLMQFITVQQFSIGDKFSPSLNKSRWWIPTAIKLLALINVANNECSPPLVNYTELYNSALDYIDLMQDYYVWQNCRHPEQFAYCQYPFILSILAKRFILTKDSEQQMILNARKSLVSKMTKHLTPQIDIFFLNINVRRSHLVSDSLAEITHKQQDLKKKLKVSFYGEPGLDMGGLTKEWFLLLVREIFDPEYGMFVYHPHSHCYWFSIDNKNGNLREYNLIGVLMGLAVYNSNILDLHFPSVCYRKLLTPPVVPHRSSNRIGVIDSPSIDDLNEIMPDVARGLTDLLNYDGNVEEDLGINFQISIEEFGDIKTFQLRQDGENIAVTNDNREDYVHCYLNWILNIAIYKKFEAFYLGFHSVCASNALIMLRGEEIEMLVCGSQNMNLSELRKVTEYDGFDPEEEYIEDFWEVVEMLPNDLKRKFLLFTTGSDRIPVGGISEMTFKVTRLPHKVDNLPEAHTCFNQLVLPRYKNRAILGEKLVTAILNSEGFGLE